MLEPNNESSKTMYQLTIKKTCPCTSDKIIIITIIITKIKLYWMHFWCANFTLYSPEQVGGYKAFITNSDYGALNSPINSGAILKTTLRAQPTALVPTLESHLGLLQLCARYTLEVMNMEIQGKTLQCIFFSKCHFHFKSRMLVNIAGINRKRTKITDETEILDWFEFWNSIIR